MTSSPNLPVPARRHDEASSPRRYCADLEAFLERRANIGCAIVAYARKPALPVRDGALLGAIFFLRGQDLQTRRAHQ